MKISILCSLSLIGLLFACSVEEEPIVTTDMEGEQWQLVKMWGQLANSETTGEDMEWQEYYLLQEEDRFLRVRMQSGAKVEAKGTAHFEQKSDGIYLVLEYEENNALIGNCTGDLKEELFLESDNKLVGTWQACDGPGLEYRKLN